MTDRPRLRTALAAGGAAAVFGSALLFLAPRTVGGLAPIEAVARSTGLSEGGTRAFVFGLVGVGCLLWVVSAPRSAADDSGPETAFPPVEARPGDESPAVGDGFDRNLEASLAAAAEGLDGDEVRTDLRSLATDAVADVEGVSRQAARRRVADGEWTDDRAAAAYLAGEGAPSLGRRLRSRVRPGATRRRRVERTVRAIETLLEDGGDG